MARKTLAQAGRPALTAPGPSTEVLDLDYGSADAPVSKPLSRASSRASKSPDTTRHAGPSTNLLDTQHSIDVEPQLYARRAPSAYETDEAPPPAQNETALQQGGLQNRPDPHYYPPPPFPQPPGPPPSWQPYEQALQHPQGPYMQHFPPMNEHGNHWPGPFYAHPSGPPYDPSAPSIHPQYVQPPLPPPHFPFHYDQQGPPNVLWQQHAYMHYDGVGYTPLPYDPNHAPPNEQPWPPRSSGNVPQLYPYPMHEVPIPAPPARLPAAPSPSPQPESLSPDAARLNKRLKRQRKKQAKRERKQLLIAAQNGATPAQPLGEEPVEPDADNHEPAHLNWSEDEKARAVSIVDALHGSDIPPLRLLDHGISRTVVEACCAELGIEAIGAEQVSAPAEPAKPAVSMSAAEEQIMSKDEEGTKLTPLEELRKKALASRLAKAAAAVAKAQAEAEAAKPVEWPPLEPALQEQLERAAHMLQDVLRAASSAEASGSRKRAYKDVDATDETDATGLDTYLMGDDNPQKSPHPPSQRQRISYADAFTVKPQAPKGDVDMNAPVPAFPVQASNGTSPLPPPKRARPVAADFSEAYSADVRAKRFLDVPHGLNTVVDISDDESDDDADASSTISQFKQKNGLSAEHARQLQRKTGDELNAIYRALNGMNSIPEQVSRAVAKAPVVDDALPSLDVQAKGASDSREDLIRKELEIQALTRRIQLRESQRKTKQGNAPSVSAQPSSEPIVTESKLATASNGSVQLDPALQKQRQALLELLASNRRNKPEGSVQHSAIEPEKQPVSTNTVATAISSEIIDSPAVFDHETDPRGPDVLSVKASEHGYKPYFPTLFQTMANKFKTRFLPTQFSMRFRQTAGPSDGTDSQPPASADVDVNKRWCSAESSGARCQNAQCSMIHASDLDPEAEA